MWVVGVGDIVAVVGATPIRHLLEDELVGWDEVEEGAIVPTPVHPVLLLVVAMVVVVERICPVVPINEDTALPSSDEEKRRIEVGN